MPIATTQGRENAAAGYTAQAVLMSLHTADPGTTGANEVAGGSPAYARQPVTWTPGAVDGQHSGTVPPFDVPAVTIAYAGLRAADGTFLDSVAVGPETLVSQGVVQVDSVTFTES